MTIQRLENVGIVVDDLAAATKTVIGSATSAARRGSSSCLRSRSAEGYGRPPTASPASVVVPGQDPLAGSLAVTRASSGRGPGGRSGCRFR
jgi:hypothetical protein